MEQLANIKEHELFSIILNKSFDAIICYSPIKDINDEIIDFRFIYLNDPAFNILKGTKEDYIEESLLSLFPYAACNGMFDTFKKTAETGVPLEDTFYYDYGEYSAWYRDSVVKYGDGIIVFFRDVTPQKLVELNLLEQNNQLENLLKEKEKLLSENDILLKETHHRVKNNLQIVSSLLNMQSGSVKNPDFLENCSTCKRRIATMAMIHHRLYEDKDFRSVNIGRFVEEIVRYHKESYNGSIGDIRFKVNIGELLIDLNMSVNIGLILNELITNAVLHAFKGREGGEINISMEPGSNFFSLVIADNGVGLPEDTVSGEFNQRGISLVRALVEQMDGMLTVTSLNGTRFEIMIPG